MACGRRQVANLTCEKRTAITTSVARIRNQSLEHQRQIVGRPLSGPQSLATRPWIKEKSITPSILRSSDPSEPDRRDLPSPARLLQQRIAKHVRLNQKAPAKGEDFVSRPKPPGGGFFSSIFG
jgi:hypothetical protein